MTNLLGALRITFIIISSNSRVGTCSEKIASRALQLALGPADFLQAIVNAHQRRLLLCTLLIVVDVTAHTIFIYLKCLTLNS